MTNRSWSSLDISGNSGPVTLGDIGAGAAVGAGGNVTASGLPPQVLAAFNAHFETLVTSVAQAAHAQAFGQQRIDALAGELDRLRKAVLSDQRDEREFKSAVSGLWSKLNLVAEGAHMASGLAQAATAIARLFGWTLAL
ncbi:MAG TPA: hypothetical protein VJ740_00875 [Hyphomicrobiaceae bacterium]|nr:hypothetical protein [Hyphomicrobiaceae bacterium]